jgi:hypothetical protein
MGYRLSIQRLQPYFNKNKQLIYLKTAPSYTPPNPFIRSLYSFGEGILPPEVFEKITSIAADLPDLGKVAVGYITQGKTPIEKAIQAQKLQAALFDPSLENLERLPVDHKSPTLAEIALQVTIQERLNVEVGSLRSSIADYASTKARADFMGTTPSEKSLGEQATDRARKTIPTLLALLKKDIENQEIIIRNLENEPRYTYSRALQGIDEPVDLKTAKSKLNTMLGRQSELQDLLGKITKITTD